MPRRLDHRAACTPDIDANYGNKNARETIDFSHLLPPYFFHAVRSFGECGAERDEIRPRRHYGNQELFAKKPANMGIFEAQTSLREICLKAKWRRERCWKPTVSAERIAVLGTIAEIGNQSVFAGLRFCPPGRD
jgi:hypothetical protein